jgi:hypothetical protein
MVCRSRCRLTPAAMICVDRSVSEYEACICMGRCEAFTVWCFAWGNVCMGDFASYVNYLFYIEFDKQYKTVTNKVPLGGKNIRKLPK